MNKIDQVKLTTTATTNSFNMFDTTDASRPLDQSSTSSASTLDRMLIIDIDDWGQDRTILSYSDGITIDLTCFELRTITQIVRKYFLKYDEKLNLIHLGKEQIGYLKQMLETEYDVVENDTYLSISKR